MLAVVDPGSPADTPHAVLARAFLKDCESDTVLLRLNRYESSLRCSYLATLRELRQQQKSRKDESPFIDVPSISEMIKEFEAQDLAKVLPPRPPPPPRSRSTKQTQFPPRRPLPPPSTPPVRSKSTPSSDPKLINGASILTAAAKPWRSATRGHPTHAQCLFPPQPQQASQQPWEPKAAWPS